MRLAHGQACVFYGAAEFSRDADFAIHADRAGVCLAVNRKWKNEAGELQEEVSFIDCTCFGRTAEVVSEYCHKGDPLLVDGRLKQENWETRVGAASAPGWWWWWTVCSSWAVAAAGKVAGSGAPTRRWLRPKARQLRAILAAVRVPTGAC